MGRAAAVAFLFFAMPLAGTAEDLLVPKQHATIQEALQAASDGDTVLVQPNTYMENVDFLGKAVTLRSDEDGVPGTYDIAPERTVIMGNKTKSVVRFVRAEGPGSVLDGFSITNGMQQYGGGILCRNHASPVIANNIIYENRAGAGGGISCLEYSSPRIVGNVIRDNWADGPGGGIRCFDYCDAVISHNLLLRNSGRSKGGAVFTVRSSPRITHNWIAENTNNIGGGLWIGITEKPVVMAHNVIIHNKALIGICGGLGNDGAKMRIVNNIIAGNEAATFGGGIYTAWSACILTNNTIVNNKAGQFGGGIAVLSGNTKMANSVFWGNEAMTGPEIHVFSGNSIVAHCDVRGGWPGLSNLDSDPLFVDPEGLDFHLLFTSPCRGAGTPEAPELPKDDFEGDLRKNAKAVDIGADEFSTRLYYTGQATPGGELVVKVTGKPTTSPLVLWVGSGVRDPFLPTVYGDFCLQLPLLFQLCLDPLPPEGVARVTALVPLSLPVPWNVALQALVGDSLSNLCTIPLR